MATVGHGCGQESGPLALVAADAQAGSLTLGVGGASVALSAVELRQLRRWATATLRAAGKLHGRVTGERYKAGPGVRAEVLRLRGEGLPVGEIARRLGLHRTTVYRLLRKGERLLSR